MSLVIHTIVKGGLVVSADTRTTCKDDKGNVRYNDTAEKIIPFPNRVVVTHTGDSMVTDTLNVSDFLLNLRKEYGCKLSIDEIPTKLLTEYIAECQGLCRDTQFIISGANENNRIGCRTYTVIPKDNQIILSRNSFHYGAKFGGTTDMAYAIMKDATYHNMSLREAIDLTIMTVKTNINAYKYHASQIVGGDVKTYIIDVYNDVSGWLKDNEIIADKNAPDNAIRKYREQQTQRVIDQYRAINHIPDENNGR